MTGSRADALVRLDVIVGEWVVEARTFGQDGSTISGAREKGRDGGEWEHDLALTYRRAG